MASPVFERAIGNLEHMIKTAEEDNREKKRMETAIEELQDAINEAVEMKDILDILINQLVAFSNKYLADRKKVLEDDISTVLAIPFPDEDYRINIDWDSRGTKPTCRVLIGSPNDVDRNGNIIWSPPTDINGEFVKQLICLTILGDITTFLGSSFFGGDEPLNSGDDESLARAKPLIEKLSENLQMILIEHKNSMCDSLDRREIHIHKEPGNNGRLSGFVELKSITDYTNNGEEANVVWKAVEQ